jgi:hypothetical protein
VGGLLGAEHFARMQERRRIKLNQPRTLIELWIEFYPKLTDLARERIPLSPPSIRFSANVPPT